MGVIYKIENSVNGKTYIGSTDRAFERRRVEHITELRGGYHDNKYLQNSWNKYGEDSFTFSIIEKTDNPDHTHEREKYWIAYHVTLLGEDSIYNIMPVEKSSYGKPRPFSDSHKDNMSVAAKERCSDPAERERMREIGKRGRESRLANGPIAVSAETREKQSKAAKEKYANGYKRPAFKLSDEAKRKISAARANKIWDGFISPDGTEYRDIINLKEFCRIHGLQHAAMQRVANGIQEAHKGWKSINEYVSSKEVRYFGPFVSPDGTVYYNITSLKDFCKEHNLAMSSMSQVETGKVRSNKGWTKLIE